MIVEFKKKKTYTKRKFSYVKRSKLPLKIFVDFKKQKHEFNSAMVIYLKEKYLDFNIEIVKNKSDFYDLSVCDFEDYQDLIRAMKLPYMPIMKHSEIIDIILKN